jgi:beta-N-acetylhexosaminidase
MLIVGIAGTSLTALERDYLREPQVSGVILFSRNFSSREQVTDLIDQLRTTRVEPLLICVDQEGGPVQRYRDGFTRLPALARIGALHARDPARAVALAEEHSWVMASEMRAIGVDISFAPVADLLRGNRAIGERAFHAEPEAVSELTLAYVRGMRLAGMAATLKHFPGHGSVLEDTHVDEAVDPRDLDTIRATDLVPFADAIAAGAEAVMMAHVRYPAVDALPAGYSKRWITEILRGELDFRGVVFSDDIGMAAAESAGGVRGRIRAHVDAGCDLVLVCASELLADAIKATQRLAPAPADLIASLAGTVAGAWDDLADNPQRAHFIERLQQLEQTS